MLKKIVYARRYLKLNYIFGYSKKGVYFMPEKNQDDKSSKKEQKETRNLKHLLTGAAFFVNAENATTLLTEAKNAFRPIPKDIDLDNRLLKSGGAIACSFAAMICIFVLLGMNSRLNKKRALPSAYLTIVMLSCICSIIGGFLLINSDYTELYLDNKNDGDNSQYLINHNSGAILYGLSKLFSLLSNAILAEADPIGINMETESNKYSVALPETNTKIPGLSYHKIENDDDHGLYEAVALCFHDAKTPKTLRLEVANYIKENSKELTFAGFSKDEKELDIRLKAIKNGAQFQLNAANRITQDNYKYTREDIDTLLSLTLKNKNALVSSSQFPLLEGTKENGGASLFKFTLRQAIHSTITTDKPSVIPVNLLKAAKLKEDGFLEDEQSPGSLWTMLVVKIDNESLQIDYIDPFISDKNKEDKVTINYSNCALLKFSLKEISHFKEKIKEATREDNLDEQLLQKIEIISLENSAWAKVVFEQSEIERLKDFLVKKQERDLSAKLPYFKDEEKKLLEKWDHGNRWKISIIPLIRLILDTFKNDKLLASISVIPNTMPSNVTDVDSGPWLISTSVNSLKSGKDEINEVNKNKGFSDLRTEHASSLKEIFTNSQKNERAIYIERALIKLLNCPVAILDKDGKIINSKDIEGIKGNPIFIYYNNGHYDALLLNNEEELSANQILDHLLQKEHAPESFPKRLSAYLGSRKNRVSMFFTKLKENNKDAKQTELEDKDVKSKPPPHVIELKETTEENTTEKDSLLRK